MARFLILCLKYSLIIKFLEIDDPADAVEAAINLATERKDTRVYLKDHAYPGSHWIQYTWSHIEQQVIPRPVIFS